MVAFRSYMAKSRDIFIAPKRHSRTLLVVLHGSMQTTHNFYEQTKLLDLHLITGVSLYIPQANYRVWMRNNVHRVGKEVERLRQDYGFEKIFLAGFSRGGWFAQHLQENIGVDGMILHSSSFAEAVPSFPKKLVLVIGDKDKTPVVNDQNTIREHYGRWDITTINVPNLGHEWASHLNYNMWLILNQ